MILRYVHRSGGGIVLLLLMAVLFGFATDPLTKGDSAADDRDMTPRYQAEGGGIQTGASGPDGQRLLERFEPPDGRVLHGWGQNYNVFFERYFTEGIPYIQACGKEFTLFSDYYDISIPAHECVPTAHAIHNDYGAPYIPIIGIAWRLKYSTDENVAAGYHDGALLKLAYDCKRTDCPIFIRPGFEFGPFGFHAYVTSKDHFAKAWIHIVKLFESAGVDNVAWVWNPVGVDAWKDYLDYYPGDEWVDWWAFNIYTYDHLKSDAFIQDAAAHGKPVMIPESCPSLCPGGTYFDWQWDYWFVPYFDLMRNHPNLKAFVYLNLDWNKDPYWPWPDTRIQINQHIQGNYQAVMQEPRFIHLDEIKQYPGLLGR